MLTAEILARAVKGQARGFSKPADVLPLYSTLCEVLYHHEHPQSMIIDNSTGRPPTIATQDEVFGPYYGPADSWCAAKLLIWAEQIGLDYGHEYDYVSKHDTIEVNGNEYFVYRYVRVEDAVEVGPDPAAGVESRPQIWFSQNPGDTTTNRRYHVMAYRKHPPITSDRIQTLIPDRDGSHQTILVPGLMKLIEGQNHGNYMEAIEYIEQTLKPRLWARMSKGAQGKRHRTTGRPY